jgi:hypothetical protein
MATQLRYPVLAFLATGFCSLLAVACSGSNKAGTDAAGDRPNWGDVVIPPVPKEKIGDVVFDESQVQSYYLTFSDEEYARLMDFSTLLLSPWEVNEDRYVQAELRFGDTELPAIGVRFKGNYSIWGCVDFYTGQRIKRVEPLFDNVDVCQRFSFKLDFNRYQDEFRLDGLKKLNLHAMAADPSKLRERLGYALFREMDVLAPRAVHARLYINGVYQGLFAAVEEIDGRFTANRFPDTGDGNLYRDLWPTTPNLSVGAIQDALRTNDDPGRMDVSDFVAFKNAVAASTQATFATQMAPYLDLDYLARYIVVDRAINNFDGIMALYFGPGWGPINANHFWYDVGAGRFALIPWDFDKILWYPEPNFWSDNAPNGLNIVPNWNVVTSDCKGNTCYFDATWVERGVTKKGSYDLREIDCDPFFKLLRGAIYDRQKAIADAFIAGPFSEPSVTSKLATWQAQIAGAIGEDPQVDATQWQSAIEDLRANLPNFHRNLSLMMSGLIAE